MDISILFSDAKKYWQNNQFEEALDTLNRHGSSAIVLFLLGNNKSSPNLKGKKGSIFWREFLPSSRYFHELLEIPEVHQLLKNYFQSNSNISLGFLKQLIEFYPHLFIETIRTNRVFLKTEHWSAIKNIDDFPNNEISNWITFFDLVGKVEQNQWSAVLTEFSKCENIGIVEFIAYCAYWYEKRWHEGITDNSLESQKKDISHRSHLVGSINIMLSIYFSKHNRIEFQNIKIDSAIEKTYIILPGINEDKENAVFKCLDKLYHWHQYNTSVIDGVCFDLNLTTRKAGELFFLYAKSCFDFYKWQFDGLKYEAIYQYYFEQSSEITTTLIQTGKLEVPDNPETKEIYFDDYVVKNAAFLLSVDYFLYSYKVDNKEVPAEDVLNILSQLHLNAKRRYGIPITRLWVEHKEETSWQDRVTSIFYSEAQQGRTGLPLRIEEKTQLLSLIENNLIDKKAAHLSESILKLLSIDIARFPRSTDFQNKFYPEINLWIKPLIKIGEVIISFPHILADNSRIGYSFVQNVLNAGHAFRGGVQKCETDKMESALAHLFADNDFYKSVSSVKMTGLNGEIDLLVMEGNCILIGELKRTRMRLNLEDAFVEERIIVSKAVAQLQKNINFIIQNPQLIKELFQLENAPDLRTFKIVPYIISTSVEGEGNVYNGCTKVSYFELIKILQNGYLKDIKTGENKILQLEEMIRKNIFWKDLRFDFNDPRDVEVGFSLTNKHIENRFIDQASAFYEQENYSQAYLLFEKARTVDPLNPYIYDSIGNCLSMLLRYDDAIEFFNKGLELRPDDFSILRNRAVTWKEMCHYDEELDDLILLFDLYGDFSADIRQYCRKRSNNLIKEGKLSKSRLEKYFNTEISKPIG